MARDAQGRRLTKSGKIDRRANNNSSGQNMYTRGKATVNQASIEFTMEYMMWPTIDLTDPDAMRERYRDYLALCEKYNTKPLISAFCFVFGTTRQELIGWAKGQRNSLSERLTPETNILFKNLVASLEGFWEYSMQNNGYRNPVTGIFLGKNNFGYKDVSETIVTHQETSFGPSKAQLEAKYQAALPEDVPAEDVTVELPETLSSKRPARKRKK